MASRDLWRTARIHQLESGAEQQMKLQGKAGTLKTFEITWPLGPYFAMFHVEVERVWGHQYVA